MFTPEFLARLEAASSSSTRWTSPRWRGIGRKLTTELVRTWAAKCNKAAGGALSALVLYVAEQGHRVNERSAGKEGGRIVCKLLSEWVESALTAGAVATTGGVQAGAATVAVEFTPPATPPETATVPPAVAIVFR